MSDTAYNRASRVDAGEPLGLDPMTDEEMHQIKEDKLELLGEQLCGIRDKWVDARAASGVEKRWREDTDQYLGRDRMTEKATMMDTVANGGYPPRSQKKVSRSTVFVNITRPKTNAVEARLSNMLYPSDDLAWGIGPTPEPKLVMQAVQEAKALVGQWNTPAQQGPQQMANLTPAQVPGVSGGMQPAATPGGKFVNSDAAYPLGDPYPKSESEAELDVAAVKARAMQRKIEDALAECDFNAEGRKMLHEVAVLGTGCLKGPIVVNRVSKAWRKQPGGAYMLELVSEPAPASEMVSIWNLYPDPSCGGDIHKGGGMWEKKILTTKQVRDLVGQPGYIEDQLKKVLEQGPQRVEAKNDHDQRVLEANGNVPLFTAWEYWGDFEPEILRACGVDVQDDSLKTISGCVIVINDIVVKGFVNPLECGSLPYDFMVLEKDDVSPWGYGVPFLCRPAQRVLNSAWRQLMDNAGASVGPQVVAKKNGIEPADGNWQIRGMKLWNCTDDTMKVGDTFTVFDIPNHSEQYEKIINMAMMFADEESSVPKIAQGNAKSDAVGVTSMEMESTNVVLGRLVKQYDDMVTTRHIRRYYDFFMAYDDDESIKGDFQVVARGSSVLLVRDQQIQALMQFGQFQGTPLGQFVWWHKWLKEVMKANRLDPTELLKSDAEIEKILSQQPPPPPEMIKQQTLIEVAKIKAQSDQATVQIRQENEMAYTQAQMQMARDNAVARIKELEVKRDMEIVKLMEETGRTADQVKADLAKTAMIEDTKRQIAQAKLELQRLEGDRNAVTQTLGNQNG